MTVIQVSGNFQQFLSSTARIFTTESGSHYLSLQPDTTWSSAEVNNNGQVYLAGLSRSADRIVIG